MKQRTAILLAMALTAFVVVLVGAVTFSITSKTVTTQVVEPEPVIVENLGGGVGQQIKAPAILPTNTPAPTVAAPSTAQPKLVSADRATRIALALYPGGKLEQPPELVNYKGKMAYEVVLSGGIVYVDAFTGKVLASVVAVASNSTPQENAGGGTDNGGGGGNDNGGNDPSSPTADVPTDPPTPPDDPSSPPPAQHDDNDDHDGNGNDDQHDDNNHDNKDNKDKKHNDKKDHQDNKDHEGDDHDGEHEGDD